MAMRYMYTTSLWQFRPRI